MKTGAREHEIIRTGNGQKYSLEIVCLFRYCEKYSLNFVWESFLQKYYNQNFETLILIYHASFLLDILYIFNITKRRALDYGQFFIKSYSWFIVVFRPCRDNRQFQKIKRDRWWCLTFNPALPWGWQDSSNDQS